MSKNKVPSTIEIINKGYLWVNTPAIAIMILIWFCLVAYIELDTRVSAVISGVVGWTYWEITIKRWIKWALNHQVAPDRLLKIGQRALLLWNSRPIDKITAKDN